MFIYFLQDPGSRHVDLQLTVQSSCQVVIYDSLNQLNAEHLLTEYSFGMLAVKPLSGCALSLGTSAGSAIELFKANDAQFGLFKQASKAV